MGGKEKWGMGEGEYSISDLLRMVVNKEAAHFDFGKTDIKSEKEKKKFNRTISANLLGDVYFMTYPRWIVLSVGFYVKYMVSLSMNMKPTQWEKTLGDIWSFDRYRGNVYQVDVSMNDANLSWQTGGSPLMVGDTPRMDVGLVMYPGKDALDDC